MAKPSDLHTEKLKTLVSDIRVAMFTTVTSTGALHTRPMATQEPSSIDELWFFTSSHNLMTGEIDVLHQVALSYADPARQRYVAIAGSARVFRDEAKARAMWNPWVAAWFPAGPADPALRLICVTVEKAEYWDSSANRMALLFENAKAALGGKPHLPPTDHAAVELKP